MSSLRIISRLDIKGKRLIKGVQLEGLRVIGDPNEHARRYYEQGADELIYMDVVASLYGRNSLFDIISHAADDIFIPITVGGGIRSVSDADMGFRSGADKVAINTAAIGRPLLLTEIAHRFGSQAVVLSIEAKCVGEGRWEAYTENGRERTGLDVVEWAKRGVEMGAGEILLTSVDREGTRKGYDIDLLNAVTKAVKVPVIGSGGMGTMEHFIEAAKLTEVRGLAVADGIHYNRFGLGAIRGACLANDILVRETA